MEFSNFSGALWELYVLYTLGVFLLVPTSLLVLWDNAAC
jgi:hypothetical protein